LSDSIIVLPDDAALSIIAAIDGAGKSLGVKMRCNWGFQTDPDKATACYF